MTTSPAASTGRFSVYTGRATNWPMVVTSAVLLVPLIALSRGSNDDWRDLAVPASVFAAGVVLYALTGSSVRTTAGPQGVSIHFGLIGWPRHTYRLDQIERAEVIDLHPFQVAFGFWWTPRRTCWTVRSGPTLRLVLRGGRSVTVSTPQPHTAVTAIDDARSA